jgi:hypothetical protein
MSILCSTAIALALAQRNTAGFWVSKGDSIEPGCDFDSTGGDSALGSPVFCSFQASQTFTGGGPEGKEAGADRARWRTVVGRRFDLSGSVAAIQLSHLLAALPQGVAEDRSIESAGACALN